MKNTKLDRLSGSILSMYYRSLQDGLLQPPSFTAVMPTKTVLYFRNASNAYLLRYSFCSSLGVRRLLFSGEVCRVEAEPMTMPRRECQ